MDLFYDNEDLTMEMFSFLMKLKFRGRRPEFNIIFWPKRFSQMYPEHKEKVIENVKKYNVSLMMIEESPFNVNLIGINDTSKV